LNYTPESKAEQKAFGVSPRAHLLNGTFITCAPALYFQIVFTAARGRGQFSPSKRHDCSSLHGNWAQKCIISQRDFETITSQYFPYPCACKRRRGAAPLRTQGICAKSIPESIISVFVIELLPLSGRSSADCCRANANNANKSFEYALANTNFSA
jgi:hypothetical protein